MSEHDVLADLIAAERRSPPVPAAGRTAAGWQRLRGSLAAGLPLTGIDLPPGVIESAAGNAVGVAKAAAVGKAASTSWTVWVGSTWVGKTIASAAVAGTITSAGALATEVLQRRDAPAAVVVEKAELIAAPEAAIVPAHWVEPAAIATRSAAIAVGAEPIVHQVQPEPFASRPARARPTPAPAAGGTVAVQTPSSLDRESALIASAQAALKRGDGKTAAAKLAAHARRFPRGIMAEDREALAVIVRCRGGDASAKAARNEFLRRWPRSVHAVRVRAACADPLK